LSTIYTTKEKEKGNDRNEKEYNTKLMYATANKVEKGNTFFNKRPQTSSSSKSLKIKRSDSHKDFNKNNHKNKVNGLLI